MNVAFIGARPPRGGFTQGERELAQKEVAALARGTRVGTSGSLGWDEMIIEAAHYRGGLFVVSFVSTDRAQIAPRALTWSQEVVETGLDPRSRNRRLADWAEHLRAFPLFEEDRSPRSGTWSAVRDARELGCLHEVVVLRPRGWPLVELPALSGTA